MKIVFITFLFITFPVHALSLEEIAKLAKERSSLLSANEMEVHALRSEAELKGKWQNPQIMGQFGTLKSGPTKGPTVEISFTQPLPLSDKFSLRKELALIVLSSEKTMNDMFKNWVGHQAQLSAWRLYVNHELFLHGIERAKRFKLIKKYLETRPRVSVRQRVERSIIASTLIQMEKMQDQKKQDLLLAEEDLAYWVGRKIEVSELNLHLPEKNHFNISFDVDLSHDVELIKAHDQWQISSLDRDLAKKERRPDLILGGGYRVENVDPSNHFTYAIVGLNIPLWDTGNFRSESSNAREMRDRKIFEEAEKKLALKHQKQIELVKFSIEQLKRFPHKFVVENEQVIHDAQDGFKQGQLDVNTFLLSETQTHEVIDQVYLSWMSYLENLSTLQIMRGESFSTGEIK